MAGAPVGALRVDLTANTAQFEQGMRRAGGAVENFGRAQQRSVAAAGSYRAGMQQLGFQINDVATQLASGTRVSTIFAQQSGQVIQAIQMMSGGASGFARFMGGAWGIALTASAVVLLPLIARLFDTRTEVEKATDGLAENARKADITREAQAAFAQTLPGVTAAIREQTEALRQQNSTLEENQQRVLSLAIANLTNLQQARNLLVQQIGSEREALARAERQAASADERQQLSANAIVQRSRARLAELEAQLRAAEAQISGAQANVRGAVVPIAGQMIEESLDRRAAETGRLRREEAALRREYEAGRKSLIDYTRELRVLRAESAARMTQIQEAERAGRNTHTLTRPVTGALLSPYGADRSRVPLNGRLIPGRKHEGLDFRGNLGDPVVAPEGGLATVRSAPGGLGLYVEIRADSGARNLLAHLSRAFGSVGASQRVSAGDIIGAIGNSGNAAGGIPHLHYQRIVNGRSVDPTHMFGASGSAQAAEAAQTAAERAARRAAELAERRQRDEEHFQEQLAGLDADILDARRRQIQTEEESAASDVAAVRAEQAQRDQRIRNEAADRTRRDTAQAVAANMEAGLLLARSQQLTDTKIASRRAMMQQRLDEQRIDIAQRDLNDQESVLQARGQLARTAMERRDIELRLLALQHQEEILAIEKQRMQQGLNAAQRAQLDRQEAASNSRYALGQQNVMRQTAGPLEAFMNAIPRTAAEMNEALQSVAVQGLGSIQDALVGVITGTEKMGSAFKKVAASIIADLLRIAIQRAIIGPLVNALGGLIPGGKTDFFGGALNFKFGGARAAGGPVLPGRTYLVGEKGPELLHMGGAGHVVANDNIGGGGGGRIIVELRDEMLQARISEGSQIEIAQAYPAIRHGVMSSVAQQGRRRG